MKVIARGIILLPVILLVTCLAIPIADAAIVKAETTELHEVDNPVLTERDEPVAVTAAPEPTYHPHARNLGQFELTAYCPCELCCGKNPSNPEYGITATGTVATQGQTVAVDPDVIPLGSVIYIGSNRYIAEDVGGLIQGKIIDIYFDSHEDALEFGRQTETVYIFK